GACRPSSAEGYRTRATGVPGLPPFPPDMTTPKPPAPPVACAKAVRAAPHLLFTRKSSAPYKCHCLQSRMVKTIASGGRSVACGTTRNWVAYVSFCAPKQMYRWVHLLRVGRGHAPLARTMVEVPHHRPMF